MQTTISERVMFLRKTLKISQSDMAKKLDIQSQASISDIERGKVKPDIIFIEKLYKQYNVNLLWLIIGEGEMFNNNNLNMGIIDNSTIFSNGETVKVEKNLSVNEKSELLTETIKRLERELEGKNEFIALLKEMIEELKTQLQNK